MASVKIKGKNVTGTKKKDKITWLSKSAWKKALTVKAGASNDIVDFRKSKYKNTIYGDAGKDTIYGGKKNDKIYGGKGNDIINAGKGNNTLYFAKGDGNDTIQNGKGTDTLVFTDEKVSNIKVAYSGDNAVITYTNGKITLKDYKKGNHSAKYIQVGSEKKAISDYFKTTPQNPSTPANPSTPDNPSGNDNKYNDVHREMMSHKLNGTDGKDWIVSDLSNDTIRAGAGDDYIELQEWKADVDTGAGNDKIWALNSGSYTFNFHSGDGNDLITYDSSYVSDKYVFTDENNIANLSFTLNDGTGFRIGYNGNKDSVNVVLPDKYYQDWVKEHNYQNIFSDDEDESYNIEMNNNKYQITAQGFALMNKVSTGGTLTTTNQNDYIYINNGDESGNSNPITRIEAGDGDDYIEARRAYDRYEEYIDLDIYTGQGNDTISYGGYGLNIHFKSDDGDDVIIEPDSQNLIFDNETSIENLSITRDSKDILIKYNNDSDSVRLSGGFDYTSIKIGDDNYCLANDDCYGGRGYTAYLGTDGDDNITYYMDDDNDTMILGSGNDGLKVSSSGDGIGAYININSDGTSNDDLILFDYSQYEDYRYDGEGNEYIVQVTQIYGTLTVKNYLQNTATKTINNDDSETFSMNNNLDAVKSAVAGWLSDNGYTNVSAAINDEAFGSDNLVTLMGSDYFGKLSWQANS